MFFSLLSEEKDEDRGGPVTRLQTVVVDDLFERLVLSGLGESWAGAAAVRDDGEPKWGGLGIDGPFEEAPSDASGRRPLGLPNIKVGLLQFRKFDVMTGEPVQEVDGDGDFLLGTKVGAAGDFIHEIHASLVMPSDVAAGHVKVLRVTDAFQGLRGPAVVSQQESITLGEYPVFDEESSDVFAGA
ncbi:hypothetical protein [Arthrobacter sp. AG258]|uniref:hypothetical protein n=1 Tax=Arthrobacter sp. AG258 TaxID=2183899 RepID=UPI001FBB8E17|nr:hypothetical protein [Arthrobacter sp. AG258]